MYRVAHVITDLNSGGAEMMMCKLVASMEGAYCDSAVISLMDGGSLADYVESVGVPLYSVGLRKGIPSFSGYLRLLALLRNVKPDLIQGWMYHGNIAASLARKRLDQNIPLVWNIRQSLYDLKDEKVLTRLLIRGGARLSHNVSRIIYNSRTSELQHRKAGYDASKSCIIFNGFDTNKFRPDNEKKQRVRSELGVSGDVVLIGLIARYHPMKDHVNFLHAALLLVRRGAAVHFVFAGRGASDSNKELVSLVSALGLSGHVSLLGERKDISDIMSSLDILVLSSSRGEGFPNVIGEAMACSVPCVVTDIGESAYVVGDTGKVIPPSNPEALADASLELVEMGSDARHRLGRAARRRIINNFSLEKITLEYDRAYKEMTLFNKGGRYK